LIPFFKNTEISVTLSELKATHPHLNSKASRMSLIMKTVQQVTVGLLVGSAAMVHAAPPTAVDLVDSLNSVFGKHAKARASHAKGICVMGHFSPDAQALQVTQGAFWLQEKVPMQGRFSVGGGNPQASDKGKTVRGFAMHLGKEWDLVTLSAPVFMVATPEEFVDFLAARQPDPATGKPDPIRVKAFNEKTPSSKAQIDFLNKAPVPASYGQVAYFGVNAFKFTNAQGKQVHGRWRIEPRAGQVGLTDAQLASLNDGFLLPELTERLKHGTVEFNLWLQLAEPQDDVKNPSVAWSTANPEVRMGQIVVAALDNTCEPTMFNPAVLPKGMALSEDPTLQVRAGSYGVSLGRRLQP
jgi:catalase